MVVSSLIATMAFQGALNPPGGVWEEPKILTYSGIIVSEDSAIKTEDSSTPSAAPFSNLLHAGSAVMSLEHMDAYIRYMIFISLGFFASMSVIFLLLSGFRFKLKIVGKVFVRLLIAVLWSAVTFMTIAYLCALQAFVPPKDDLLHVLVFFEYKTLMML